MRRADDRLRPACECLEDRRVPSQALPHAIEWPEGTWLADQTAFQADARGMHDLDHLSADVLAVVAATRRHVDRQAELGLARDVIAMVRTSGPHADTAGIIRLIGAPDFTTFAAGTEPAYEARYGPALEGLGIPGPLVQRFFDHRRAFGRSVFTPSEAAGPKMVDDLRALIDDGVRDGSIHPGDPHYRQLSAAVDAVAASRATAVVHLPIRLDQVAGFAKRAP